MNGLDEMPFNAVELAPRVWWVGATVTAAPTACHVYLIEQGDHSVLIDPGGALGAEQIVRNVDSIIGLQSVRWLVCSQPDADLVGAIPKLVEQGLHPEATIVTHGRIESHLVHCGVELGFWRVEEHFWRLSLDDRTLQFVLTPYLHFAGSFATFDEVSGTLFSSELFGAQPPGSALHVTSLAYLDSLRTFHECYMPSRDILGHSLQQIRSLALQRIAPRRGSIIPLNLIEPILEMLEHLECGIFLLARDDPSLALLLSANRTVHEVINTLVREQQFSVVAAYLAGLASQTLGAEYFELWAGSEGALFQFDESDGYAGHPADPPSDVAAVLSGGAAPTGVRLILPLNSPISQRIGGAMVWGFRERKILNKSTMSVLIQIIGLVEVGLEREVLHRSTDLERAAWHTQAIHDPLTGLYNRVSLEDAFLRLASFDDRNATPQIAALMIDIDHFKRVNDSWGHATGDLVIQWVAQSITSSVRPSDIAFRFGGEEFLVLLSNVDVATARRAAERVRLRVAATSEELPDVAVSVGIALRRVGEARTTLIERADEALYLAKRNGRDRVEVLG